MPKHESSAIHDHALSKGKIADTSGREDQLFVTPARRLPGVAPRRRPAATPAPAIAQMPIADYADEGATEIDSPHVIAQKKWLDSIETIPFDPSMRVHDLGEGTPPRAVPPVRVDAPPQITPRRRPEATPRPSRNVTPRPVTRHPNDNNVTRSMHIDVAGGHVSFSPDPDAVPSARALPLVAPLPTPLPSTANIPLYGAPALPPHASTAMAVPPQAVMPTQIAQPLPASYPTQVAQALPALVRPYQDGVTPYPVPQWATGMQPAVSQSAVQHRPGAPYVLPQNHLDIYADTDERSLPPSGYTGPTPSLRPSIGRYLVPIAGVAALAIFVGGYFAVRSTSDTPSHPTTNAPIMMQATAASATHRAPPPPIVTELPAPAPAPAVAAIVEPIVEQAAPVEPAAAEPAAAEPVEIEMAPIVAKKSSSSRRAKRAVAVIELPAKKAPKVAPTKIAPTKAEPTKAEKPAKIAKSITARDPILEEIEKPSKSVAKATGPGKLMISSSVPTLIYIDGRSTNLMTPKTMNLSPGTHKITLLELKTRKAKTVDVEVEAGTVAKIEKKF